PHPLARRRAVEVGVLAARQAQAHARRSHSASFRSAASFAAPPVRPFRPWTWRAPASSTSVTRLASPGSKRTAVPAGTFSRMPNAWARSNRSARFTSKKWKCEPTWIGRSPVFSTVSSRVRLPTFASMSPLSSRYSPGIITASLASASVRSAPANSGEADAGGHEHRPGQTVDETGDARTRGERVEPSRGRAVGKQDHELDRHAGHRQHEHLAGHLAAGLDELRQQRHEEQ